MSNKRARLALLLGVAVVEPVVASLLIAVSHREPHKILAGALEITAGLSFVAAGAIAMRRRPDNRTGFYLVAVGYLWFLGALVDANNDVVYAVGAFTHNLAYVPFAALVLSFPTGRLARRADRLIVLASAVFVLAVPPLLLLFADRPPGCSLCGTSPIVVYRSHALETTVDVLTSVLAVAIIAVILAVLVRRWHSASAARRRILGPIYLSSYAALVALLLGNAFADFSTTVADIVGPIFLVLFNAVSFAYLFGILRSRLARGPVAELVVAIGEGAPLRDAIADALNDPSLELAYWIEARRCFVDREGHPFELPLAGATLVERDGRRVGALVHDESLHTEPELVESVAAAAALALDNERLQTELRVQYDLLTTVVDTAPSLLMIIDPAGRVANLNVATVYASGYDDEEEVRGRFFWDVFIGPHEREAVIGRFHDAAPEFPPSEYENVFTNARGEELVIAWRSAPLRDDSGEVVGIVAGGLDVTERKRHEEEVRASRARLVAAADGERRRLERNLHDGAQQRLVSLSLALRLAQSKSATDPQATSDILAGASEELALALEELRELARGIHPAVLTDRGLTAALEGLAARSPLPVELTPLERPLPESIEAAAYYVVSESLANVVKHAGASAVEVRLHAHNGSLVVEVEDDGCGGADPAGGSGLRGLADRLAALDGELRLERPAGGGTRVVAAIPLEP